MDLIWMKKTNLFYCNMKQLHWWLAGWGIFEFEINKKKSWRKEIKRCRWEGDLDYKKRDMQKKN